MGRDLMQEGHSKGLRLRQTLEQAKAEMQARTCTASEIELLLVKIYLADWNLHFPSAFLYHELADLVGEEFQPVEYHARRLKRDDAFASVWPEHGATHAK